MQRLKQQSKLAFPLLLLFSHSVLARPNPKAPALLDVADSSKTDDSLHLNPNEFYPYLLNKELNDAPEGLHISVGGERSFLTGALNPRTKQLLILDRSLSVVRFARINILLLKISESREDYLKLRTSDTYETWENRAKEKGLSLTEEDWAFWNSKIRPPSNNGKTTAFEMLHKTPPSLEKVSEDYAFKYSNYMHIDSQYSHLKELADTNKIQAIAVDINDTTAIQRLGAAIQAAKLKLSSIDISNVWWKNFTLPESLSSFMKNLTLTASKKTKVIASDFVSSAERILNHQIGEDVVYHVWDYNSFNRLADQSTIRSLFHDGLAARKYNKTNNTFTAPHPIHTSWFRRLCRFILQGSH